MVRKVLIPNRGEIAVRIIRAAHQLGIKTVVTLTELEQDTIPAKISDEVHYFKQTSLAETYLNIPLIIELAKIYNADSIHPGYGFMAENHNLANACKKERITFIGPSPDNLKLMGDKQTARDIARKCKVPITQSWEGEVDEIIQQADEMPYPVLIKAAMGGGGKGMVICQDKESLQSQLLSVSRQAKNYFGDDRVYVEQYLESPRHIEVQVLADEYGNTIHLFERECSVQRRFQKIIEEAPAPNLSDSKRKELTSDAINLCKSINYKSAGTLEFLVDNQGKHYFLEMNTRIQVEHCVTEEITGIDLVEWQFRIANGEILKQQQDEILINGHSLQARIYAEDPSNNFSPYPGSIEELILPENDDLRMEMAFDSPTTIHSQFDPMIAKFIVHRSNRAEAIKQLSSILSETIIGGIKTNLSYLQNILNHQKFQEGNINTHFCQYEHNLLISNHQELIDQSLITYSLIRFNPLNGINGFWRLLPQLEFIYNDKKYKASYKKQYNRILLNIEDKVYQISDIRLDHNTLEYKIDNKSIKAYHFNKNENYTIVIQNQEHHIKALDILPEYQPKNEKHNQNNGSTLYSPLPGQVAKVLVKEGQKVKAGDVLVILEAMKMENRLSAWKDTKIEQIHVVNGDQVKSNQLLITTN
nr:biotin carboxylase N-terminal domain-containing protein [uncultured Carboxylicivirga sp.]